MLEFQPSLQPSKNGDEHTPLMKQYWELKSQAPDALLFFRMGDFYELFGQDAVLAAQLLDITLTSRDKNKPNPLPMAGVPHHSVQGYIQKLLNSGKKIAICEQLEDLEPAPETLPKAAKGPAKIVRREIVRVLTPGVQFDAEGSEANYLATLTPSRNQTWILSCLDASTGEALVSDPLHLSEITHEWKRLPIRHFLNLSTELDLAQLDPASSLLIENLPRTYLTQERALSLLKKHYDIETIDPFINTEAGILGLGVLVTYVLRTQQQERLAHLKLPEPLQKPKALVLGPSSSQHLDLPDLFQLIDQTRSTLGARQLRRWLMAPLRSVPDITDRQAIVKELSSKWSTWAEKLALNLSHVYDLERIAARINTKLANPKDTLALGQSLLSLEKLKYSLSLGECLGLKALHTKASELITLLGPLAERITRTQNEEAPVTSRDGDIFKLGTTPELDRLISLTENGQRWLVDLETRERELTGIPSLKVRYNRVFGYYIEITQSHLKNVPAHYQRKQTMVGAERFFTDELKKFEEEILTASVKQKSLEQELFTQLIEEIQNHTPSIMEAARIFGETDALLSLASLDQQSTWNFPEIDDSLDLSIQAGRHPMVDRAMGGAFVPNDLDLSPTTRLTLVITGPNMGGKSTVMRQTALIILLGQMGAPVPAVSAKWGVFSSLYTRIGAQDAISRGQSTFMVEMSELAHILHHADDRSLLILDEIGRGTSTYDGISVAWAALEWISMRIQARTLFATHYHELIHLSSSLPLLANAHMSVESERNHKSNSLRFLYELREGPTNESYGIHVAQLAGLPKPVIERAWAVLEELELHSARPSNTEQLSLFDSPAPSRPEMYRETTPRHEPIPIQEPIVEAKPHPALKELEQMNINEVTPIQALNLLVKLKELTTEV